MSTQTLKEKLETLQCHFTWSFEIKDKVDAVHILQSLAVRMAHTPYQNQAAYLAMRAYLHQLQGLYQEALQSLQEAEDTLRRDHPNNFSRQVLVTYGNYAWIYYHLADYHMVELYLGRVHEICSSLASPDPYAAPIPEILAQKGWSLLTGGFRNGEQAKECFQKALRGDATNKEYQAGLAIAAFAVFTHCWKPETWREARALLEELVRAQPQNYEAKVYLAKLLKKSEREQAARLLENVTQNSLDPEVLRNAARLFQPESLQQGIDVLQQAIALDPSYHLLHYDLGVCYKKQLEGEEGSERREELVDAAIEAFKKDLQTDPCSVSARLALAEMYGENAPHWQEELYLYLMEELPSLSKRCQQTVYLHWGDFLLNKKNLRHEAAEMYKAGFLILSHPLETSQLKGRLERLMGEFLRDSETAEAEAIYRCIREGGKREASEQQQ